MGVLFALIAAVCYGSSMFLTQMGLKGRRVPALRGVMVNLVAANAGLWLALLVSLLFRPVVFNWNGIAYFIAAGLMAPLLGRYLGFMSIQRVGASRGSSLQLSENLFAGPIAFLLFGQSLSVVTIAGIAVVVVGVALFINEIRSVETPMLMPEPEAVGDLPEVIVGVMVSDEIAPGVALPAQDHVRRYRALSHARAGVAFGLAAGLFFAGANLFRQAGVEAIPSALLGSAIGTLAALIVAGAGVVRSGQVRACFRMGAYDATFFATSGISSSAGMLFLFWALDAGSTVAVATAIKNIAPLVTFGLVAVFLSRTERISVRVGLLVTLVVFGAVLTTVGKLL